LFDVTPLATTPLFHLAFPVTDLHKARSFYGDILGCVTGRESERWIDFDFFGHQLVAHLVAPEDHPSINTNQVDGHAIPASHFGVILEWQQLDELAQRLKDKGIKFMIEPYVRFEGRRGEQMTLFVCDPSNNYLEFKAFRHIDALFAKDLDQH
jgi:extradiol dioxygenase family protein